MQGEGRAYLSLCASRLWRKRPQEAPSDNFASKTQIPALTGTAIPFGQMYCLCARTHFQAVARIFEAELPSDVGCGDGLCSTQELRLTGLAPAFYTPVTPCMY